MGLDLNLAPNLENPEDSTANRYPYFSLTYDFDKDQVLNWMIYYHCAIAFYSL